MASDLPVVDFAPFLSPDASAEEKRKVALELDKACREVGFFYLKNHGVPADLITEMLVKAREFFETATDEEKKKLAIKLTSEGGDNARGYLKVDNASGGSHEAVDFYRPVEVNGPPYTTGMGQNKWPDSPNEFKATAETYIEHLETLGSAVMQAMAIGLNINEDILLSRVDKAFWNLRILGYEGRKNKSASSTSAGIGEHTDFGILTFLLTDPCKKSLQVLSKSGEWIWADPVEGCYICNIGDMLCEWTGGAYKSTLHRVCLSSETLRISIPFFFDPNWDAFISPVIQTLESEGEKDRGIRYKDKFVQSVDYPLWRDPLVETASTP